jgi:site-specific recombinase XerD
MPKVVRIRQEQVTPEEALQQHLLLKRAHGLADTTLIGYAYHISRFFKNNNSWENLTDRLIEYMSDPIKANSYNVRIRYLKSFFSWSYSEGFIKKDPLKGWKAKKEETRIVDIPEAVLQKILEVPNQKTFVGLRDYCIMLLQLDTGIRPKEALTLTKEDICFHQMLVSIKSANAKTRIARSLPISPVTAKAIKKLLAVHHELWTNKLIFCTFEGKPMNKDSWGKRMDYYSNLIGHKIRAYDLRHCFALYYLRAGGDVFSLQRMMGHTNLAMTQKYIALTEQDLRNQHAKSSPLNTIIKSKRIRNL